MPEFITSQSTSTELDIDLDKFTLAGLDAPVVPTKDIPYSTANPPLAKLPNDFYSAVTDTSGGGAGGGLFGKLLGAVGGKLLDEVGGKLLGDIVDKLSPDILNTISDDLLGSLSTNVLGDLIDSAPNILQELGGDILDSISPDLFNAISPDILTGISTANPNVFEAMAPNLINNLAGSATSNLDSILPSVLDNLAGNNSDAFGTIADRLIGSSALDLGVTSTNDLISTVTSKLENGSISSLDIVNVLGSEASVPLLKGVLNVNPSVMNGALTDFLGGSTPSSNELLVAVAPTVLGTLKNSAPDTFNSLAPDLMSSIVQNQNGSLNAIAPSLINSLPTELQSAVTEVLGAAGMLNQPPVTEKAVLEVVELGSSNDPMNITGLVDDLFSKNSKASFTDRLDGIDTSGTELISSTDLPNLNTTIDAGLTDVQAFIPDFDTVDNPILPGESTVANPDVRPNIPIANEPITNSRGRYPFNQSFQSESGHIIEIDDTPGAERLLTQHATGTYNEINENGRMVTKVVGDNYTIVAEDNFVTIQGSCAVRILGDATVRIGGHLTIQSDAGINLASKGDFRVKARSIQMEAEKGDCSIRSAGNTNIGSGSSTNMYAKQNVIEGKNLTSIKSEQVAVDSKKFSARGGTGVHIKSEGPTNITGSPVNVAGIAGKLNVGVRTNLMGLKVGSLVLPIFGRGAASASPTEAKEAKRAKGSGLEYTVNPDRLIDDADDDPVAVAAAIKHGLDNNLISKRELDTAPTISETDASGPQGNIQIAATTPTIPNLKNGAPPENIRLSPHFTLAMLSSAAAASSHVVKPQHGLTTMQIVGNLQLVAINCLEPIRGKYPGLLVTCGFRSAGYKAKYGSKGRSQHELGQACDLQFTEARKNPSLYYEIAKWIRDNVPFDQLILEYKTTGTKMPWIHVSFNPAGNRPNSASNKIITMNNGSTVGKGLIQLR